MKLVTWNTQSCKGIDGQVNCRRILEHARALADFDVLCLQEIAQHYPGLTGAVDADQPAAIAALLPGFHVFFGAAVDEFAREGSRRRFGNLVATRLPVAQVQHHVLPYPADPGEESMPRVCTVVTVLPPDGRPLRVMGTHLEFYSKLQRLSQARALRTLHLEYFEQAQSPPKPADDSEPGGPKRHTADAILCGDFNCGPGSPEHAAMTGTSGRSALWDCWPLLHGKAPYPPTFCVHEQKYLPRPVAFDFVFVSGGLKERVRRLEVDGATRASDHQPVLLELG
jgi:endonuclease/exonuclease/phosphatase family metal-dependent hydrolase